MPVPAVKPRPVRYTPVAFAAATLFASWPIFAQPGTPPADEAPTAEAPTPEEAATAPEESSEPNEIVVTASRRKSTIQDVPLNVSAVTGDSIQEQGLTDLSDLTRVTPGLFLVDQGGRDANLLSVRGLNANSLGASEGVGVDGGGVVAQYLGDVPLFIDLHLYDLERVEILLGPQGTLYGAGTLGGAIRYLPNRPKFNETSLKVDAGAYRMRHSDSTGADTSVTFNLGLSASSALRGTIGYSHNPGFIDSPFLVREAGVSNPEPDLTDPVAVRTNLRRAKDVDHGETVSGRLAFRQLVGENVDINLTGYYQDERSGGRTINQRESFDTADYSNAERYGEPNDRENKLGTLEINWDLGWSTLTSATGYSEYEEKGHRDQTDLLLDFEYGYEDFPSFSAFTTETVKEKRFDQEIRLVSPAGQRFQWIGGLFYNHLKHHDTSGEFVPGIPEFFGIDRPDNLEFFQVTNEKLEETAAFGEVGFDIMPAWNVTAGGRVFKFKDKQFIGVALPLVDGSLPDETVLVPDSASVSDTTAIFKLNTSFKFSPDLLGYATLSQGYRTGGANAVALCEVVPPPPGQNICALPSEREFTPDKTLNHEIGIKSKWFGGKLILNGDLYYIRWKKPQLAGTTFYGAIPITTNGGRAESKGAELALNALISDHWSGTASYTYTDAKLTKDTCGILRTHADDDGTGQDADGLDLDGCDQLGPVRAGRDGDRLPGSPKHQGNMAITFTQPFHGNLTFDATWGLAAHSDVITKVGKRANGESLAGYATHELAFQVKAPVWSVRLWAKNLFDRYGETGVRSDPSYVRTIDGSTGEIDPITGEVEAHSFRLRRYYHSVQDPMRVGLTVTYDWDF